MKSINDGDDSHDYQDNDDDNGGEDVQRHILGKTFKSL